MWCLETFPKEALVLKGGINMEVSKLTLAIELTKTYVDQAKSFKCFTTQEIYQLFKEFYSMLVGE